MEGNNFKEELDAIKKFYHDVGYEAGVKKVTENVCNWFCKDCNVRNICKDRNKCNRISGLLKAIKE